MIFYSDVDFHRPIIIRNKKDFKIEHRTKAVLDIIKYKDPLETKISAVLGKEHEKGVDIDAMLYENNVRINFNEHIKKEVKKLDQVVTGNQVNVIINFAFNLSKSDILNNEDFTKTLKELKQSIVAQAGDSFSNIDLNFDANKAIQDGGNILSSIWQAILDFFKSFGA